MSAVLHAAERLANGGAHPGPTFYLGFDCATKTFGFILIELHAEAFRTRREHLYRRLQEVKRMVKERSADIEELRNAITELEEETSSYLRLLDGETRDLVPDRPDKEIHTIERLRALRAYVGTRVLESVKRNVTGPLEIAIEFQEGANAKARIISPALAILFLERCTDSRVYFVGPSLKNKLHFDEKGQYRNFAAKYIRSYDANKAHAKYNFAVLEQLFGTQVPQTSPPSLRGHIADAALTVLGHLYYGDRENPEAHF